MGTLPPLGASVCGRGDGRPPRHGGNLAWSGAWGGCGAEIGSLRRFGGGGLDPRAVALISVVAARLPCEAGRLLGLVVDAFAGGGGHGGAGLCGTDFFRAKYCLQGKP